MRIKTIYMPFIIIGILVLGILISNSLGYWQTTSSKIPKVISKGDFVGQYNPADIRGSYTFADIESAFKIPVEVLAEAFGIENDHPEDMQVKELENIYGILEGDLEIGTSSIRYFVALYMRLPYDVSAEIPYLTEKAVQILTEKQCILSDSKILVIPETLLEGDVNNIASNEIKDDTLFVISGQTTIKDIIEQGVLIENLEKLLGTTIKNKNLSLRSICEVQGVSFSHIKKEVLGWIE